MYFHKIDPNTFEDKYPWERELYITMLVQKIEEEKEKAKQEANERKLRKRK